MAAKARRLPKPALAAGAALLLAAAFLVFWKLTAPIPISNVSGAEALAVQFFDDRPPAPDFTLPSVSGGDLRLSDLRGKVVFVNFFATWCGPCRWEMPEMEAVYQNFKDKGFAMVAISVDSTADPLGAFAASLNLTFPIVHDPGMRVARSYGFRGPPLSYLIDKKGRIVGGASGPRRWNSAAGRNLVEKLLAERPS